jgi:hypothetical protein
MTFTIDSNTLENDEWDFDENANGDGVLTHKSTGATLVYDSTNGVWEPSGGVKTPSLEAGGWDFIGTFATVSDFENAASVGQHGYIESKQQFAVME